VHKSSAHLTALFIFVGFLGSAATASASPWTLPKDDLALMLSYDFGYAQREFLPDSTYQHFPLNGQFQSNDLRLDSRYGFTDRFEGEVELTLKSVNYAADPVVLGLPKGQDTVDLAGARASVTDFSQTAIGAGDAYFAGRYNFYRKLIAFTEETRVKLPTGYDEPQQTFDPESGTVDDDVALGDGQTDIEESLLLGGFIPFTRSFFRLDAGFRFRMGDPGHQAIGAFKVGQFIGKHFIAFAGVRGALTVTQGNVIGKTFVATVDNLQPEDVAPGDNTKAIDLRLDKDFAAAEGGAIFTPFEGVEIQAAYSYIFWGANIPAIHTLTIGTALRLEDITAE